jgi:2-phospho-L-lactate guanylyltransferase (CobY/MobA/RfbA family)
VTEICRHLQEFSPDIHVVVPNNELEDEDVRTRISADDYGNLHCKGKYCSNAVRREITNMSIIIADIFLLTTKVAVAHEVAHIEYSTLSDVPVIDSELVNG